MARTPGRPAEMAILTLLLAAAGGSAGQPYPEILWWTDLDAPSFGSAASADIDGDGKLEIVFGTYFNDEKIHALDGEDGGELWSFDTGGCNDASPVIHDVDLDGALEVIVPASSPQMVYCLDGSTGDIEWSRNTGHCIDSPPAIDDMDGDGKPEVVLGTFEGYVFCLEGESGEVAWQVNLGTDSYIQAGPNLLDLDGDADPDVVVAQWLGDCRVYGLDGSDGSTIWFCDSPQDNMYHGGSFADIDEDGADEIAIGCYDSTVYLINSEDGSVEWEHSTAYYAGGPTSVADLNSDGHLEVVYAAYNRIGAITHDNDQLWEYTAPGGCFRGAAIANINGDSTPDVVFGTDSGSLVALRGIDGSEIWTLDLSAHYGQTYDIDHAPTIADFDGDGKLDVFVVGGYGTSSSPQDNHGRAYLVGAGPGTGQGWQMFRHDHLHTALFDTTQTGIGGQPGGPSLELSATAAPNPFSSGVSIRVETAGTDRGSPEVRIEVFDLSGRMIDTIHDGCLPDGSLELVWPGRDSAGSTLPSGTYLLRASAEGGQTVLRLVLLR